MEQQNQQLTQEQKSLHPGKNFLVNPKLPLIAAIAAVVLAVGGVLLLQAGLRPSSPTPTPMPSPQPQALEGWQTYRSDEFGFEVKYPSDWRVNSDNEFYSSEEFVVTEIASIGKADYIQGNGSERIPPPGNAWITFIPARSSGATEYRTRGKTKVEWNFEEGSVIERNEVFKNLQGHLEVGVKKSYWKNDPKTAGFEQTFEQILSTFRFGSQDLTKLVRLCRNIQNAVASSICWWEVKSIAKNPQDCEAIPDSSTNTKNGCYAGVYENLAISQNDMSLCEKIPPTSDVYGCKIAVAQTHPTYNEKEAEAIITHRAREVVQALKEKDMEKLASFVHPEKPLRFWSINASFELPKAKIQTFFTDQTKRTGSYDGSGLPFTFTQAEYYNTYIYDRDYLNAPEVSYELSYYSSATTIGDQFERYHKEDPVTATYAFPQSSPDAAFDWRNLRLWFTQENGIWYLREIMQNQWAI